VAVEFLISTPGGKDECLEMNPTRSYSELEEEEEEEEEEGLY
jgi:hypothetical protein